MLQTEQKKNDMLKKDKKKDQKTLYLNMGVVAPVKSAPTGSQTASASN